MNDLTHATFRLFAIAAMPAMFGFSHIATAQSDREIDRLFDWAEQTYPYRFDSHKPTQSDGTWRYRYFPEKETHVGVNTEGEVWVLGDVFGGMAYIGTFADMMQYAGGIARFTVGGPGASYPTLQELFAKEDLGPGDIVDVRGGIIYDGDIVMPAGDGGAPGNPVILRGVGSEKPHLRGGKNTIEFRLSNHVVMENFEISGTVTPVVTTRCVFHHAHDIVLRNVYVHDCPQHGVLGADQDSGSLTIEYSEIYNAGSNGSRHAIYMATDEVKFPDAVFRLQYSYVHDSDFTDGTGLGGHLVKSRAGRNEIYYNWLEDAFYHELELIGPDKSGARAGWSENLVREDSDVVGNVIVHNSDTGVVRFGGDGTGQSNGRYRFINNTVVHTSAKSDTIFRLFDGIESLDAHNNVLWHYRKGGVRVIREVEAKWTNGSRINGSNNWIGNGSTFEPSGFTGTIKGAAPGFINVNAYDVRPAPGSPLLNQAAIMPHTPASYSLAPSGYAIAPPSVMPVPYPPQRAAVMPGAALPRLTNPAQSIGAFEQLDGR